MFDWVNWAIELVIATFFISGFYVTYYRIRGFMRARYADPSRRERFYTAFILTGFVLALTMFCLVAARWDPTNAAGYLNWALFILVIPLIDEGIGRVEFTLRALMLVAFWGVRINIHDSFAILSVFSLAFLLSLIWFQRRAIAQSSMLRLGVATWLSTAFWLTQTQLSTMNLAMNGIMFLVINVFTLLYWSSERVNELERTRLVNQVNRDELTGARSYFAFKDEMFLRMRTARTTETPLTLAMYDLDFFKKINDEYGHQAGNEALIQVTKVVQNYLATELGQSAHLFRTGGEEFNIVFNDLASADVHDICQTILERVRDTVILFDGQQIRVTLSMGVTSYRPTDVSLQDFYERADALLYTSKQQGRNRITFETDPHPAKLLAN